MARKIKKKLSRKELLREEDEFISFTEEATEWASENWPLLLIAIGVAAIIVVVGILVKSSIADSKLRLANQVNEAITNYTDASQTEVMSLFSPDETTAGVDIEKNYEDSAYKFEKLMRDEPKTSKQPVVMFYLGNSFLKSADYEKARASYGKLAAMENAGSLADMALYNTGMSYYMEGNYPEALKSFEKLIESETPTARVGSLVYAGKCLEETKKPEKAIEYYRLAIDAYSDSKLTLGLESRINMLELQVKNIGSGQENTSAPTTAPEEGEDEK